MCFQFLPRSQEKFQMEVNKTIVEVLNVHRRGLEPLTT